MKVGIAILSLCIAVAQLAPLAIIPYMAGRKAGASVTSSTTSTVDNSGKPSREELKVSPEDQVAVSITPNSSIELIGYGSIGYNAGLFTVDSAVSTDTSKTIIYKDNPQFNLFQCLILIFKRMKKILQIIIIHLK